MAHAQVGIRPADGLPLPWEAARLRRQRDRLLKEVRDRYKMIGSSEPMQQVYDQIDKAARATSTVLITGESGTGKEMVARAIHLNSSRAGEAFVTVNCAAIPPDLIESELFGHEEGAFTGARKRKKGLLEVADEGTAFLDEIGEMPLKMQAKMLRVLETQKLRRVGGTRDVEIDVRFMAASNRDLKRAIDEGLFREDLYYRLSVMPIHLPPLRERMEDLELFVAAFLDEFNQAMGRSVGRVNPETYRVMRQYDWPGNIRELRNVIERAMLLCEGDEIQPAHLPAELGGADLSYAAAETPGPEEELPSDGLDLKGVVTELERHYIEKAMERTSGNQTEAAKLLSISRDQLRYRLEKYDLD